MPPDDDFRYTGPLSARRKHPPGHRALFCTGASAEILLRRWGPDGMGKLGGTSTMGRSNQEDRRPESSTSTVALIITAMRDDPATRFRDPPLGVINATLSSTGATMNHSSDEDVEGLSGARLLRCDGMACLSQLQVPQSHPQSPTVTQAPGIPHPQSPTRRQLPPVPTAIPTRPLPSPPKKLITLSLTSLEKAVATRLYFENIYFPLYLLHPPPRNSRLQALERDLTSLSVPESPKAEIRERWKRNETEYLREKRRRMDARSFVKLKTIGHETFGVVSLVREQGTLREVDITRKGQEGHVRAERDVLKSAALIGGTSSDWIVKLFYSFQDRDHLYYSTVEERAGFLCHIVFPPFASVFPPIVFPPFATVFPPFFVSDLLCFLPHLLPFPVAVFSISIPFPRLNA
ncbi:hypothetical protein M422DRAFT_245319 [Sphaerobolus stellatus SS14]|nr:hypothetical protein M422DRAFT_245319 [Sphaerobolus stellatus SS14]